MGNKHISDELLAAFMEGNVNADEMVRVLQTASDDASLQETLDIALQIDDDALPMMQMAAEGGRNLCDVQCESYVLQHLGVDSSMEELFKVAKDNRWIRRAGTPLFCMGNLLEYMGLEVNRKYDATPEDIKTALDNGYGIIAAVDCDKLYPERPDEEDATNHAIVLTAIDTVIGNITIYDPENTVETDIKIPLFMAAWKESRCYLVCARKK